MAVRIIVLPANELQRPVQQMDSLAMLHLERCLKTWHPGHAQSLHVSRCSYFGLSVQTTMGNTLFKEGGATLEVKLGAWPHPHVNMAVPYMRGMCEWGNGWSITESLSKLNLPPASPYQPASLLVTSQRAALLSVRIAMVKLQRGG